MQVQGSSVHDRAPLCLTLLSPQAEGLLPALCSNWPRAHSLSESVLSPFQMTQQMARMNFCGTNGMLSYGQSMNGGNGQAANQTLSPQMWK